MSDTFADLLQRNAEELPVFVRNPQAVRRDAEVARARRQRAGVVAVAVVTALIVGAGAVLRGTAGGADGPPADDTPSPTDSPIGTQTDRGLLRPPDLPSSTPFGEWTGRDPLPLEATPFCPQELADASSVTAVKFHSSATGVEGYQAVAEFSTQAAAAVFDDDPAAALAGCAHLPGTGYDSWGGLGKVSAILPHVGRHGRGGSVLVVSHTGRFLSLLWLVSADPSKIPDLDVQELLDTSYTQLYEGTAPQTAAVPDDTLERALLHADELPFGSPEHPQARDRVVNPHDVGGWLVCDVPIEEKLAAKRAALFVSDHPYGELGGERLYVALDEDSAHQLLGSLAAGMRTCREAADEPSLDVTAREDFPTPEVGDEARGITFRFTSEAGNLAGEWDVIYVVLARSGSVVTQVWRREQVGPRDPGAAAVVDLARAAVERIRSVLPPSVTDP